MKNRGFTMIELLACIVILGILSTIGVMAVSKYLKQSQRNTYLEFENSMLTSAKDYFIDNSEEIPPLGGQVRLDLIDDLIKNQYSDQLEDPSKRGTSCKGYVDVTRSHEEGFNIDLSYRVCLICSGYQSDGCR